MYREISHCWAQRLEGRRHGKRKLSGLSVDIGSAGQRAFICGSVVVVASVAAAAAAAAAVVAVAAVKTVLVAVVISSSTRSRVDHRRLPQFVSRTKCETHGRADASVCQQCSTGRPRYDDMPSKNKRPDVSACLSPGFEQCWNKHGKTDTFAC